jgi:ATP-dependent Clp protease ATP-binding subunit ClpX
MEKEVYYGVLMSRTLIDPYIYLYKPISLVEGTIDNSVGYDLFIDNLNNTYLFTTDAQSLSEDEELSVAFVIKEDDLLNNYPNLCRDDALDKYYDGISSVANIGFYLLNSDKIVLLPFNLLDILSQLNSKQLEGSESQTEIEFIDGSSKDFLSELLEEYDGDEIITIAKENFKELLEIKTYEQLHGQLEEIYKSVENLYQYFDSMEIDNLNFDFKQLSGDKIVSTFNECYDSILQIDDINELKSLIKKIIDMYTELCLNMDSLVETDEVLAGQDFLYRLIDEYEALNELSDIKQIKNGILKIKKEEEKNIIGLAQIYDRSKVKQDSKNLVLNDNKKISKNINVRDMKKFFDEKIIGQEEAKRDVIQAIVMNQLSNNPNDKNSCLLIGPTGSGKTLIAETVSEYLSKPMEIIDTTQLTVPGYVGANIEDFLSRLLIKTNGDVALAEEGIVVFDEIDKKGSDSNSDVSGKGVLNNLLTFIQGTTYDVKYNNKTIPFNTSKLTVFATGAFTNVAKAKDNSKTIGFNQDKNQIVEDIKYEKINISDLEKYGLIPIELLGRFSTITQLSGHTKESLKTILIQSNVSPLLSEKNKLSKLGIELKWTDGYIEKISQKALGFKTGARSLKQCVEESIKNARWEVLENLDIYSAIILSQDTVDDNECCTLVDKSGNFHELKDIIRGKENTKLMVLKK